jgi:3',5'-cyclic AMP phosphodiesterase CpdA
MKRLIHLSDPHFGAADAHIAAAFIETARDLRPDLTVLSGDLSMTARRSELDAAADFIHQLPTPRIIIPGNHDIPYFNHPYDRFFRPFRRYQQRIAQEIEPTYQDQFFDIMCLNSARPFGFHTDWSDGRLSRDQLSHIALHFGGASHHGFKILVIHHPLLELKIPNRALVRPHAALMEALELSQIDLVLCGHFHRSQIASESLNGGWKTLVSQAPTVCSTRLQGEPQGFHEILIDDAQVEIIQHAVEQGRFRKIASFNFDKGAQGWNSASFH